MKRLFLTFVLALFAGIAVASPTPVLLNGLSTTVTSARNGSGQLSLVYCYNPNSSVAYIQIFDAATPAAVTLGTTSPKLSLGIPATSASGYAMPPSSVPFLNGIQVAATTTATGNSAPSSNMDCNAAIQ